MNILPTDPLQTPFELSVQSQRAHARKVAADMDRVERMIKALGKIEYAIYAMPDSLAALQTDLQAIFDKHRDSNGWPEFDPTNC